MRENDKNGKKEKLGEIKRGTVGQVRSKKGNGIRENKERGRENK